MPSDPAAMLAGVVLHRSRRRRTIALRVDGQGEAHLYAPHQAPARLLEDFLARHDGWLRRHRDDARAALAHRAAALHDGASLPLLDELLVLHIWAASRARIARVAHELHLALPAGADPRLLLERWYRRAALDCVATRVARYAPLLGVQPRAISIRGQRTRWGSCSPRGRLSFNWRLLQAPAGCLDYVVVHELAHLLHPNHSPRFWAAVARILPDHADWQRKLRAAARQFVL